MAPRPCELELDDLADPQRGLVRLPDQDHDEYSARRMMQVVEQNFTAETWFPFLRQTMKGHQPKDVARELSLSLNAVIKATSRVLKCLWQELERLID